MGQTDTRIKCNGLKQYETYCILNYQIYLISGGMQLSTCIYGNEAPDILYILYILE